MASTPEAGAARVTDGSAPEILARLRDEILDTTVEFHPV